MYKNKLLHFNWGLSHSRSYSFIAMYVMGGLKLERMAHSHIIWGQIITAQWGWKMNEWIFSPAHPRLGGAGQALNAVDAGRHAGQAFLPEHTHSSGHCHFCHLLSFHMIFFKKFFLILFYTTKLQYKSPGPQKVCLSPPLLKATTIYNSMD